MPAKKETSKKRVLKRKVSKKRTRKRTPKNRVKKRVETKASEMTRQPLVIHADPKDLAGAYSNFAAFKHSKREIVLDFAFRMGNDCLLVSRIVTSPQHAKAIHKALGQNIELYEKTHGEIEED